MISKDSKDLQSWKEALVLAVNAQASDDSLWNPTSVGEAYVTQSLRWLHMVIEDNDVEALTSIVDQSTDAHGVTD